MINIVYIADDHCKECKFIFSDLLASIEEVEKSKKMTCNLKKIPYNSKAAIKISLHNGIKGLPAIVVSGECKTVLYGKKITREQIKESLL